MVFGIIFIDLFACLHFDEVFGARLWDAVGALRICIIVLVLLLSHLYELHAILEADDCIAVPIDVMVKRTRHHDHAALCHLLLLSEALWLVYG